MEGAERKTGYYFPRVINIKYQVPHSNLYFVWHLARGFWPCSLSFSCHSAGARLWPFEAMNTRLWRKITNRKPSRGLRRKITQSGTAIFHVIINVSGATVLPWCWLPTLGMCDSPGEGKGGPCSYLARSKLHYNRVQDWSRVILSVGSASSSGISNTTLYAGRLRGRERQGFGNNSLSK